VGSDERDVGGDIDGDSCRYLGTMLDRVFIRFYLGSLIFAAAELTTAGIVRTVDQINVLIFLFIVPMFTLCGTYFPRTTLPPMLGLFAGILPLASLADLLRWDLGLPSWWYLSLLSLLVWLGVSVTVAWHKIREQLIL
jgi:lipooligosaccharide transport system permease protein